MSFFSKKFIFKSTVFFNVCFVSCLFFDTVVGEIEYRIYNNYDDCNYDDEDDDDAKDSDIEKKNYMINFSNNILNYQKKIQINSDISQLDKQELLLLKYIPILIHNYNNNIRLSRINDQNNNYNAKNKRYIRYRFNKNKFSEGLRLNIERLNLVKTEAYINQIQLQQPNKFYYDRNTNTIKQLKNIQVVVTNNRQPNNNVVYRLINNAQRVVVNNQPPQQPLQRSTLKISQQQSQQLNQSQNNNFQYVTASAQPVQLQNNKKTLIGNSQIARQGGFANGDEELRNLSLLQTSQVSPSLVQYSIPFRVELLRNNDVIPLNTMVKRGTLSPCVIDTQLFSFNCYFDNKTINISNKPNFVSILSLGVGARLFLNSMEGNSFFKYKENIDQQEGEKLYFSQQIEMETGLNKMTCVFFNEEEKKLLQSHSLSVNLILQGSDLRLQSEEIDSQTDVQNKLQQSQFDIKQNTQLLVSNSESVDLKINKQQNVNYFSYRNKSIYEIILLIGKEHDCYFHSIDCIMKLIELQIMIYEKFLINTIYGVHDMLNENKKKFLLGLFTVTSYMQGVLASNPPIGSDLSEIISKYETIIGRKDGQMSLLTSEQDRLKEKVINLEAITAESAKNFQECAVKNENLQKLVDQNGIALQKREELFEQRENDRKRSVNNCKELIEKNSQLVSVINTLRTQIANLESKESQNLELISSTGCGSIQELIGKYNIAVEELPALRGRLTEAIKSLSVSEQKNSALKSGVSLFMDGLKTIESGIDRICEDVKIANSSFLAAIALDNKATGEKEAREILANVVTYSECFKNDIVIPTFSEVNRIHQDQYELLHGGV